MNEKKRATIDALNEMFWSQSVKFREEYRQNYFTLLEYITEPDREALPCYDEIRQSMIEQDKPATSWPTGYKTLPTEYQKRND